MPVRMLNFVKEPPPKRQGKGIDTPIYKTEEWQDLVMSLGSGLKPQEYVTVNFPDTHHIWQEQKNPIQNFIRCTQMKIKELGLPYDVWAREKTIYIVGRGVIS